MQQFPLAVASSSGKRYGIQRPADLAPFSVTVGVVIDREAGGITVAVVCSSVAATVIVCGPGPTGALPDSV